MEKEADAEGLFWEVRIDDHPDGNLIFNHYLRVKVFTERGRESQSRIDLEYGKMYGTEIKIKDIAARTIKPDGSIVELKKEDIFERTIAKASGLKIQARSFAMPAVEPGCIIEYRWKEIRVRATQTTCASSFNEISRCAAYSTSSSRISTQNASFNSITMQGHSSPWVKEKNGFYSTTMTNMPAMQEEVRMPPEDQVKTWMLVYYSAATRQTDAG